MKRLLIFVLLLSPTLGLCQGVRYPNTVFNPGVGFPFATIRVCGPEPVSGTPCNPLVTVYSDPALTIPLANPFTADANGNFYFFGSPSVVYHVQVSGPGLATSDIPYITLPGGGSGGAFYQAIYSNGTVQIQRPSLNFISGTNATVTCADNSGLNRTDCTVASTGGGGAGDNAGVAGQSMYYALSGTVGSPQPGLTWIGSNATFGGSIAAVGPVSIGSSPPTACSPASGCVASTEASTAGTPTASVDYCRADSTAHGYKCSLNNAAEFLSGMNFPLSGTGTKLQSTNLGSSVAGVAGLDANVNTIQASAHTMSLPLACSDSSGSGSAQSCSTSPTFTPASGDTILYSTTTTNTGDVTINVNASSAVHVRKWQASSTLASGDLKANTPLLLTYDGTYWEAYVIGNAPAGGGTVTSTGTTGFLAEFTSSTNIGNSPLHDVGGATISSADEIDWSLSNQRAILANTAASAGNCPSPGSNFGIQNPGCIAITSSSSVPSNTTGVNADAIFLIQNNGVVSGTSLLTGVYGLGAFTNASSSTFLNGVTGVSQTGTGGTVTNLNGVEGIAVIGSGVSQSAGTATTMSGVDGQVQNQSTSTQTNAYALHARAPQFLSSSAVFTHTYGLFVEDQSAGGGTSNPDPHGIHQVGNTPNEFQGHINQIASGNWAGSCAMSAGTTCTFSITAAYTGTPLSFVSLDAASTPPATAISVKCAVSGTTVTITAGASNSLTWDCLLVGNPN